MNLIIRLLFFFLIACPCIITAFESSEDNLYPLYTSVFYFIFGLFFIIGLRNREAVYFIFSAMSGIATIVSFILWRKMPKG